MSAQEKRKKSRLRIRDKYTQIANLKKLNDRRETDRRGRKKKLKTGGANIPSEGQRKLVLKAGGHGMGSDYKKSEQKAFKKAKDWQKSDEKKKITEKRKANSKTGSGSTTESKTSKAKKVSRKGTHVMNKYIRHNGKIISRNSRAGRELEKKLKIRN